MPQKIYKPEEIIAKLRQVEVLTSQRYRPQQNQPNRRAINYVGDRSPFGGLPAGEGHPGGPGSIIQRRAKSDLCNIKTTEFIVHDFVHMASSVIRTLGIPATHEGPDQCNTNENGR